MTENPERDPLTDDESMPAPLNTPDAATTDADVDEVRASEPQHGATGDETDPYELRSMSTEPNGNADDPASYLNP